MALSTEQSRARAFWSLVRKQHGSIARRQLLGLGFSAEWIQHRIDTGRLRVLWRGVYAVGRLDLTREGMWMAAVLACGERAVLSHESAAALSGIRPYRGGEIEVSVRGPGSRRRPGIVIHRRPALCPGDVSVCHGIPVTSPARTLIDLGTRLGRDALERAINEADKLDLIDPDRLLSAIDERRGQPGVGALRAILDRRTFTLSESALERRFLPLARSAGLPRPETQQRLNGFRVDFYWPELGLVVETDGLRYHRTAAQQARDRVRDQAHAAAGLTPLRFTRAQVVFEPRHVERTLSAVARRLART